MNRVDLALVLNAHLPFVRHPEYPVFLEERWLFEALSETYLPLLRVFHKLEEDGIPFRLTMSFSPTLTSMLTDTLLQDRYRQFLDLQLELAERELVRTEGQPTHKTAKLYRQLHKHNQGDFNEVYQGNILRGFSYFQKKGHLEIITSAATHAFLPLYQNHPETIEAQLQVAAETHLRAFGRPSRGLWLPECAYYPGLEKALRNHKFDYFFSSAHAVLNAKDFPRAGVFAPLSLPGGTVAFPRDMESTNALWSPDRGYPSDPVYRDFYRDIGFDLDLDYLQPYMPGTDNRLSTGFKYHAVTGPTDQKVLYDPDKAQARVREHVQNFLYNRGLHAQRIAEAGFEGTPLVVSPFDTELFGHWWFEGVSWLDTFFRQAALPGSSVNLVAPSDVLATGAEFQQTELAFSSWAAGGYAEAWLDGSNDWIYRHTFKAVERMVELVGRFPDVQGRKQRALNQAAREVLLSQASDWPLIIKSGTTVGYAERRVKEHIANFTRIYESLSSNTMDTEWLTTLEKRNNLFPELDYKVFRRRS
jgi:1,4-alpha-glucan branching enzyme